MNRLLIALMFLTLTTPFTVHAQELKPFEELTEQEKKDRQAAAAAVVATAGGMTLCTLVGVVLFGIFLLAINGIPIWVAMFRKHPDTLAIALVTVFFGWTMIGWLVALIWSVKSFQGASTINVSVNNNRDDDDDDNRPRSRSGRRR